MRLLALGPVLIAISRLPQLLGGQMFPDGDECIIGLMAKHMAEGREFSLFFWGQNYGLSVFEAGAAAIAFRLFGMSDEALNSSLLALWAIGWVFFVLAARKFGGKNAGIIAGVALIVCPAWASWSMKARGGYVTAFVFTSVLLWLVARLLEDTRQRAVPFVASGVVIALIFLSQPIWIPAVLPFLVLLFYRRRRWSDALALACGLASVLVVIYILSWDEYSSYWQPDIFAQADPAAALLDMPRRVWVMLTGAYSLCPKTPATFTKIGANLWLVGLVGSAAVCVMRAWRKPRFGALEACLLSFLAVLAVALWLDNVRFQFRYLLPAAQPLVLATALAAAGLLGEANRTKLEAPARESGDHDWRFVLRRAVPGTPWKSERTVVGGFLAALLILCALSLGEFRSFALCSIDVGPGYSAARAVEELVAALDRAGIRHVYSVDRQLQWTIMYASRERILARWTSPTDRVPAYPVAVDRALHSGQRAALVGPKKDAVPLSVGLRRAGHAHSTIQVIAGTFFVLPDPGVEIIRGLGFRLNE